MFDLHKIYPVVHHLKTLSYIFDDKGTHTQMLCPLCDDMTRRSGTLPHGHLYVNNASPVFYCFRCSTAGSLVKLLVMTGFEDEDTLKYISSFIFHSFNKDYYDFNKKKIDYRFHNIHKIIRERNLKFKSSNPNEFKLFNNFLFERLGEVDYTAFLIYPDIIKFKNWSTLGCCFSNYDAELSTSRVISNKSRMRYQDTENTLYYFQRRNFEKQKRIVMSEGPFDMISLYLFNNLFNHENTIFYAVCGKKYISAIERLIFEDILIGTFEINLIFDADVHNYKSYLYQARLLTKQYNPDIIIKGYKPAITGVNDTGDYPSIQEV